MHQDILRRYRQSRPDSATNFIPGRFRDVDQIPTDQHAFRRAIIEHERVHAERVVH